VARSAAARLPACVDVFLTVRREIRVGDVLGDDRGGATLWRRLWPRRTCRRVGGPVAVLVFPGCPAAEALPEQGLLRHTKLKGERARRAAWGLQRWKKLTTLLEHKVEARDVGRYEEATQIPGPDSPSPRRLPSRSPVRVTSSTSRSF
jgi:hypothetical protein